MIIDFHTHIFPPEVRDNREDYVRRDPTFAEMYANPKAKIATADDLLASMDEAGVDVSVALGFAWQDHELCVRHNDYLLESAANSSGRIVPFTTINMADERAQGEISRCAKAGAKGLGELRPESQGWELDGKTGGRLAAFAEARDLILLFHVTEPVGHRYPGKAGLRLDEFYRFLVAHPNAKVVGAHLAGGLPLYHDFVPEMGKLGRQWYVDTAAWEYIYRSKRTLFQYIMQAFDSRRTLFGSDFPLLTQAEAIRNIQDYTEGRLSAGVRAVMEKNATRLLEGFDPMFPKRRRRRAAS